MRELADQARDFKISIAEGKARLAELDAIFEELGLGTQTTLPKSSLDLNVVREKVRQRKAQLAFAGNAIPATSEFQEGEGTAYAGIASTEALDVKAVTGSGSMTPADDALTDDDHVSKGKGEGTDLALQKGLKLPLRTVRRRDASHQVLEGA
jgi:hypothetical protein